MAASKRTKEVWTTYRGRRRQVKVCGIREPKNRVKNYRVEIRPPNFKTKIWVGTFETWNKAVRAFDAAIYLIGKDTYYHIYPEDYFPKRPSLSNFPTLKAIVQAAAKEYSEKDDYIPVKPSSLLADTSTVTILQSVGSPQPMSVDRPESFPTKGSLTNLTEEVDDVKPTQQDRFDEFSYTSPYLDHPPDTPWPQLEDLQVQDSMKDDEVKVPAAYLRGLHAPNPAVVNALLEEPPLESFDVFPYIRGGDSVLDLFDEDSCFISSTFAPMLEDYFPSVVDDEDHPWKVGGGHERHE